MRTKGSKQRYYIHLLEQNLTDPSIQRIQHYKHPDNINMNTFNTIKHTIYLHSNAYNRNIISMFKFSIALRSSQLTASRNVSSKSWSLLCLKFKLTQERLSKASDDMELLFS
jgi:hypothetical protein